MKARRSGKVAGGVYCILFFSMGDTYYLEANLRDPVEKSC